MDFRRRHPTHPVDKLVIRRALVLFLAPALAFSAPGDWQRKLSSDKPGPFPLPHALRANYSLGWFTFKGGEANAVFSKPRGNLVQLEVRGGTTGWVRGLWKLDASHKAIAHASTLRPIQVKQIEAYSGKTITTRLAFNERGVTSLRVPRPPEAIPPKEQKFLFPDLFDMQTALLWVRSQRLVPGESYSLVVFPATTPYLATVRVIGREKIRVKAGRFSALKFELKLQKVTPELGLEPHKKFKRGVAWISDDADRIVLRAEAEIFVGSVWAELQSVKLTGP